MSDIGQAVFKANPVGEPTHGPRRTDKIPKFPGTVKACGVVVNMIVDVMPVDMCGDKKSVIAFCPAHCRFITYPVGFLRRDLAGKERLPDLIAEDVRVSFLLPARDCFVPRLAQQKFRVGGSRVAHVGGNQFAVPRFRRVPPIIEAVSKGLRNGFPLADMARYQARGRHAPTSFPAKNNFGPSWPEVVPMHFQPII